MSAQLAVANEEGNLVETSAFQQYLKSNLTSDVVMQVLEECLLEENATYNPIDFEIALRNIQRQDGGRYLMLKTLLEGFATKEGLVMLDPKSVTASYKQRVAQLELLKSMGRFRRFVYRLAQAVSGLLTEKTETAAIQEAIQLTGEVQIARNELTAIELKKSQAERDADKVLSAASTQARKIVESANQRATEKIEQIYAHGRNAIVRERADAQTQLEYIRQQILKDMALVEKWEDEKRMRGIESHKNTHENPYYNRGVVGGFQEISGVSGVSGVSYPGIQRFVNFYRDGTDKVELISGGAATLVPADEDE